MIAILLSASALLAQATAPEKPAAFPTVQLFPEDDAAKDPDFAGVKRQLLEAVAAKNPGALLQHVAPTIKAGLGGEDGIEDFKKMWDLNHNPEKSRLWAELGEVLGLGAVRMGDLYIAPCLFARFPDEFDALEFSVITGAGVNIREKPATSATVVEQVTYLIVRELPLPPEERVEDTIGGVKDSWRKIELPSGSTGFVFGHFIRSPLDFRAGFAKVDGAWKMTFFLAGD